MISDSKKEQYDVSVIICTYNSSKEKLIRTLTVASQQKDIDFEIIVTDDGSKINPIETVDEFRKISNVPVKFVPHDVNQGTVKNCLDAVNKAKGKYIFLTSPGDYLYDDATLHDFFAFAEKEQAKIVFGNAYNYSVNDSIVDVNENLWPKKTGVFRKDNLVGQQLSFYFCDYILGASYFREREAFIPYLEKASMYCKYMEDTSTSMLCLMDGIPLIHYDRYIVWYEFGTGISTSKNSKWDKIISAEVREIEDLLLKEHGENKVVRSVQYCKEPFWRRQLKIFITSPYVFFKMRISRFEKKKKIKENYDFEIKKLKKIIGE